MLIIKQDQSSVHPKDWRPITVLNVDDKIFTVVVTQCWEA